MADTALNTTTHGPYHAKPARHGRGSTYYVYTDQDADCPFVAEVYAAPATPGRAAANAALLAASPTFRDALRTILTVVADKRLPEMTALALIGEHAQHALNALAVEEANAIHYNGADGDAPV